jgi:hypothetical protein
MRTTAMISLLFAALCLPAPGALAQSEDERILEPKASESQPKKQSRADDEMDDEDLDEQVFYSGFGLNRATADFSNLGSAINIEGVMGFRIPTVPWFGIEIDIAQTLIPGENEPCGGPLAPPCPGGATSDPDEFAMQGLGLSAAFKSSGRFYVTGKYGYRYVVTSISDLDEQRSGNGFAFGAGYRWGRGLSGVELVYTQVSDDIDSVGLVFFVRAPRR